MKIKKITAIFMAILMFSTIFLGTSTVKAEETEQERYILNFEVTREQFSEYENLIATYSNHWMKPPENDIFNRDQWQLNDFSVEYELHIDGQIDSIVKSMSYSSADSSVAIQLM
ncbi:MAG: hypothetical protein SOW48_00915 [Peptoniphilaceae bacterium]|nr:hypothetical protein [Peptoniphilaceae bacterium]MDY3075212.1 hypothetical protein [Peptoniphilaceae bacterium]